MLLKIFYIFKGYPQYLGDFRGNDAPRNKTVVSLKIFTEKGGKNYKTIVDGALTERCENQSGMVLILRYPIVHLVFLIH